ncbi:uncharacterized protein [Palaemon carinicauda]|uniref:uncharacterized protein n=1 Tax=Palaemon carinicauda TaxID=392227 RepID=UPI0035B66836
MAQSLITLGLLLLMVAYSAAIKCYKFDSMKDGGRYGKQSLVDCEVSCYKSVTYNRSDTHYRKHCGEDYHEAAGCFTLISEIQQSDHCVCLEDLCNSARTPTIFNGFILVFFLYLYFYV